MTGQLILSMISTLYLFTGYSGNWSALSKNKKWEISAPRPIPNKRMTSAELKSLQSYYEQTLVNDPCDEDAAEKLHKVYCMLYPEPPRIKMRQWPVYEDKDLFDDTTDCSKVGSRIRSAKELAAP